MQPQQISLKRQCLEGKDRLSQLPDHILHHILYHLRSTKEAATTSLLSRRWLNLWVSMPDLFFDYISAKTSTDFINLVNRVLLLRDPSSRLRSFILRWLGSGYDHIICDVWARHALARNVNNLSLHVDAYHNLSKLKVDFFESIFACQSLHALFLAYQNTVVFPALKPSRLGQLKRLTLKSFVFKRGTLRNLISGCTALEELFLISCGFSGAEVTSLTLRKLVVRSCYVDGTLQVISPKINTFHYIGNSGSGKIKFPHMEVVTTSVNVDALDELSKLFHSQSAHIL